MCTFPVNSFWYAETTSKYSLNKWQRNISPSSEGEVWYLLNRKSSWTKVHFLFQCFHQLEISIERRRRLVLLLLVFCSAPPPIPRIESHYFSCSIWISLVGKSLSHDGMLISGVVLLNYSGWRWLVLILTGFHSAQSNSN